MLLKKITPTPEQRKIFFLPPNEPVLLSGKAGSGKTTTAILRAAQLVKFYERQGLFPLVGFFVYNNTLKTYLNSLAKLEIAEEKYRVSTLDLWCRNFLEARGLLSFGIADDKQCTDCLKSAIQSVGLGTRKPQLLKFGNDFLIEEVNYILGRFGLDTNKYILSRREGRGSNPIFTEEMKRAVAEEIIPAYQLALEGRNLMDWNSLRYQVLSYIQTGVAFKRYDIVVVDEAQDLSAIQIKIALELVSPQTQAITFIKDGTQRIYKANYIWEDTGMTLMSNANLQLEKNYRNTKEIAQVAASLMNSEEDSDISVIDPSLTSTNGLKPTWVQGRYSDQKMYLRDTLKGIDFKAETVGILHARKRSVDELFAELVMNGFECTLLLQSEVEYAPDGIFLSTLHSAKGLEFDHIFIIGYDDFFAPGPAFLSHRETSAHITAHRKLLYTAMSRARKSLTILSSVSEYSRFLNEIDPTLINRVRIAP
jgi:superfamily I DNA/RNA helicase